ncbi:MAG TPA: ABC transporter ATP-binding protein [Planctomycetota bacterium]
MRRPFARITALHRVILATDLAKSYAGRPVLRGVSLRAEPGHVFGFVGPNGAGKTTFLKCLVGVVRPDSGSIEVDGVDARGNALEARRRVGYAPSETALYQRMPVEELVDFAISFHPAPDRARARELIGLFGLPPRRRAGKLSHGMKRKLLLAQAFAANAPVLLLDEPMEGLDPEARRIVEDLLREEAARGRTVFFSSHDLASVQRVCHEVAFLRSGNILECASVPALLERVSKILVVVLREPRSRQDLPDSPHFQWSGSGERWNLTLDCPLEQVLPQLAALPLAGVRDASGGLEELFEALYGPDAEDAAETEA